MERLKKRFKNLDLWKSFILVTAISLLTAFLLTLITISICVDVRERIAPTGVEITFDEDGSRNIEPLSFPSPEQQQAAHVVECVQYLLTMVYFTLAIAVSGAVFYRSKLKTPIKKLELGAQKIMEQDLDFTISSDGMDELGQLCAAFDKMRLQLKQNNQEMWRLTEERKRLNAAFSHDLRNPVTVLKGSIRVMEKGVEMDRLSKEDILKNLDQLAGYTTRIQLYVEAMSGAQKLEETICDPKEISFGKLKKDFQENTRLLLMESGIEMDFHFFGSDHGALWLDEGIFYNISENLIVNASRYAKKKLELTLSVKQEDLCLTVQDDGPGFSEKILRKGMEPFIRDGSGDKQHFGMGLYICRILSEKHRGTLCLENTEKGALAIMKLKISKP